MTKKLSAIILITLFSAVAMFANDISTEVQEEQKIQQQATPDFSSNSKEFSFAEKSFADQFRITNPRDPFIVYRKFRRLIRTGIGLAVAGGTVQTVGLALFLGLGAGLMFINIIFPIMFFTLAGICGVAGTVLQLCCISPFCKAGLLATRYRRLYNVKLKDAYNAEAGILSMHDSENKEFGMAMAFAIK